MLSSRFVAILCSVTIATVPVEVIAEVNHNSAHSGRKGDQ